jgi:hypothetical protein
MECKYGHDDLSGHVSKELRNDKEVVMIAVKKSPASIKYASSRLQRDKDVLIQTYRHYYLFKPPETKCSFFYQCFDKEFVQKNRYLILDMIQSAGTLLGVLNPLHAKEITNMSIITLDATVAE